MPSTRTPISGTITMNDAGASVYPSGAWSQSTLSLGDLGNNDLGDSPPGFKFAYGPGAGQFDLNSYHDMIGHVRYYARSVNVRNVDRITVDFLAGNGSNGQQPGLLMLDLQVGTLPDGEFGLDGAHWATVIFIVEVVGMSGGQFDVYFDGNYIDTIFGDGSYLYDNGGSGYTNSYANNGEVYLEFLG